MARRFKNLLFPNRGRRRQLSRFAFNFFLYFVPNIVASFFLTKLLSFARIFQLQLISISYKIDQKVLQRIEENSPFMSTLVDRETVKKLTKLSRIQCTEEEEIKLLADLQSILSYVELMNAVDTENVKPCNHVLEEMCNVEREDVVGEVLPREIFLANAPDKIGGMIRVPSVIKSAN